MHKFKVNGITYAIPHSLLYITLISLNSAAQSVRIYLIKFFREYLKCSISDAKDIVVYIEESCFFGADGVIKFHPTPVTYLGRDDQIT